MSPADLSAQNEVSLSDLEEDLFGDDVELREEAAEALYNLLGRIRQRSPQLFRTILSRSMVTKGEVTRDVSESCSAGTAEALRMIQRQQSVAITYLLRAVNPKWLTGGEFFGDAPPVRDLVAPLLSFIDSDHTDYSGFAAVVLGRYGPEAAFVLPELLFRLKQYRTDCHRAAGLTWAAYAIGGVSPAVEEVLCEIAARSDSCPRAQRLARQLLELHEIAW